MTAPIGSDRRGGRLGIIVPSSNTNLEPHCAILLPSGVTAHFTRLGGYDVEAIPGSAAMRALAMASVDGPLDLLTAARVNVIGYGCASATLSCGWTFDRRLCADMEAKAEIPAVTVAGAMVEALSALNASRIGFTDFRAVEAIGVLERELDKPVVTSNQALIFGCLARIGIDTSSVESGGRLFKI